MPLAIHNKKRCLGCGSDLPIARFDTKGIRLFARCKNCRHAAYEKEAERNRNRAKEHYYAKRDSILRSQKQRRLENGELQLFRSAKRRAKEDGIEITISASDIKIPRVCPLLGIPIYQRDGRCGDNSPSLDRINPKLGYIPENIHVISFRANTIKSNASLLELETLTKNLRAIADYAICNPICP